MPWETAVDRSKKRSTEELIAEDPQKTNVTVLILQQVSLFRNWWAAGEEKCSIGLAGRCVFSFAAAGEPGPPKMANFGVDVVLPVVKDFFRTVLKTLGPHAPLHSEAKLLNWCSSEVSQDAVYHYRCLCHELTKTLSVDETFASCLNKSGYWLSVVAFWNAAMAQMWPMIIQKEQRMGLDPKICDEAVKVSMDFFTYRFMFGASILSADLRKRTWQNVKKTQLTPADCRWSVPAALLLKASCGTMVTPSRAARAAPMFRKLNEQTTAEAQQAGAVYVSALQYLEERGFGNIQVSPNSPWPAFCKRHYYTLPDSCLEQLAEIHVHPVSFGLHLPSNNEAGRANTQVASNTGVEDAEVRFKHILCHGCGTTWTSLALVPNTGAGPGMHCKNQKMEFVFEESDVRQADAEEPAGEVTKQDARADLPIQSAPNPLTQSQEERRSAMPNFTAPRGEEVDPEDTPTAVPQEQRIYKTVFCGSPTNHITDFGSLRDEVTKILGAQRDAGVYTFSDKGLQSTTRRLTAACKPDACKECNVRVWAFSTVSANAATLVFRISGQHGALQPPSGGMLWTMAEQHIINQISLDKLSTATLRSALKNAGLPVRALPGQLHDYVSRERKKSPHLQPKKRITVGELQCRMASFQIETAQWQEKPLHQLMVLPGAVVDNNRVCVVFTCPGMIARARAAENKVIKLAVDGKQKILSNEYTIVTLSFLVPSTAITLTRSTPQRNARVKAHTCTQEPFLQAFVNSESEENMTQTFETACSLGEKECGLDLRTQVLQVHKDYAKGIEASRIKVFPYSRPCDDYPHMRRAAHSSLQKLFGLGEETSGPQRAAAAAPCHVYSDSV